MVLSCNELVSLVLEASCSIAYIPVLSLDMVETTPLLMDSTLIDRMSSFHTYIMYFFQSFVRLDFGRSVGLIEHFVSAVWQGIKLGFTTIFVGFF